MPSLRNLYIEYNQKASQIEQDLRQRWADWSPFKEICDREGTCYEEFLSWRVELESRLKDRVLWRVTRLNLDDFQILNVFEIQADATLDGAELASTETIDYCYDYIDVRLKFAHLMIIYDLIYQWSKEYASRYR